MMGFFCSSTKSAQAPDPEMAGPGDARRPCVRALRASPGVAVEKKKQHSFKKSLQLSNGNFLQKT